MSQTLDTLEIFDEFKRNFSAERAHGLSKALRRVEEARLDGRAAKRDLLEVKVDLVKWIVGPASAIIGILFAVIRFLPPPS